MKNINKIEFWEDNSAFLPAVEKLSALTGISLEKLKYSTLTEIFKNYKQLGLTSKEQSKLFLIQDLFNEFTEERVKNIKLNDPYDIFECYKSRLRCLDQEHFVVLYLDSSLSLIKDITINIGGKNESIVDTHKIFKEGLLCNANAIIGIHNHPSGSINPSNADDLMTQKLIKVGKTLGMNLLDHIIIGDDYYSYKKEKSYIFN